ncbi:hypothetical protein ScPMuIL_018473 [Solemya velum]
MSVHLHGLRFDMKKCSAFGRHAREMSGQMTVTTDSLYFYGQWNVTVWILRAGHFYSLKQGVSTQPATSVF